MFLFHSYSPDSLHIIVDTIKQITFGHSFTNKNHCIMSPISTGAWINPQPRQSWSENINLKKWKLKEYYFKWLFFLFFSFQVANVFIEFCKRLWGVLIQKTEGRKLKMRCRKWPKWWFTMRLTEYNYRISFNVSATIFLTLDFLVRLSFKVLWKLLTLEFFFL